MSISDSLDELIHKGEMLAPQGGSHGLGYNGTLQPDYLSWRFQAIALIKTIGASSSFILEELESDTDGPYFYESSANRILGSLKAAQAIVNQQNATDIQSGTLQQEARNQEINNKVFIGHGRNPVWSRIQTFLEHECELVSISFESDSRAGENIIEILEEMLSEASFAVLVLTAEDETHVGDMRARQNVIHEAGLFQGRLGFKKAVLLIQSGVEEFSNIAGLQHIPFSDHNIEQTFYELGRVLRREGLM